MGVISNVLRSGIALAIILSGPGLGIGLASGQAYSQLEAGADSLQLSDTVHARDTCPAACMPKLCTDEATLRGTATTLTYICPPTPTPAETGKPLKTEYVTVTETITVTPIASQVEPTSTVTQLSTRTVYQTKTIVQAHSTTLSVAAPESRASSGVLAEPSASFTFATPSNSSSVNDDKPTIVTQHSISTTYKTVTLEPSESDSATTSFPTLHISGTWGVFPSGYSSPCNSSFAPTGSGTASPIFTRALMVRNDTQVATVTITKTVTQRVPDVDGHLPVNNMANNHTVSSSNHSVSSISHTVATTSTAHSLSHLHSAPHTTANATTTHSKPGAGAQDRVEFLALFLTLMAAALLV